MIGSSGFMAAPRRAGTVSIGTMIKRLSGLHGIRDISKWEDDFIGSMVARTKNGEQTTVLFPNEVSKIEEIHNKHFA